MALAGFDPQQGGELAHDFVPRLLQFFRDAGVDKPATFQFLEEIAQALTGERYRPRPVTPQAFLKLRALFADRREALVQEHGARETAFFQRAFENYTVHERLRRTDGAEAFNLRDEWMGKNLIWLAEERFPKKKIVVWAATRHVAHGLKGVRGLDGAPYHDTKSMGEWVHEHFGRQCYTIGFAAHGGRGGRWFSGKWDLPPPAPGSIEDTLFRYGKPRLFLNLRGPTPFDKPLHLGVLAYARDLRARWPQVIDGLVYIEQMVPAAYMGD
jgi:erythromycin esterase